MPGKEHEAITRAALTLLPLWQKKILKPVKTKLIKEFCHYPDWYFGKGPEEKKVEKYFFQTDGIQFHYLPDTPIIPFYRYYRKSADKSTLELLKKTKNQNYLHAVRGFTFYLRKSVTTIQKKKIHDAGAYLGCLLHMLQDYGYGAHSLEGPYGTDIYILNRLFPEPKTFDDLPTNLLASGLKSFSKVKFSYKPKLLGLNLEEVVFHLYDKYVKTTCKARKITFQITLKKYLNKNAKVEKLVNEMFKNVVRLCADVICTVLALAENNFDNDIYHLNNIYMSDLEPVSRPWGTSHYRFLTLLKDQALDKKKKFSPLQLIFKKERKKELRTYQKGLGLGSHYKTELIYEIPKKVYKNFSCALGLHPDCLPTGMVNAKITMDQKTVFKTVFNNNNPAAEINIHNPGGKFELIFQNNAGMGRNDCHLVWGNPLLTRIIKKNQH